MRSLLALSVLAMVVGCGKVTPPGKKVILLHANGTSDIVEKGLYRAWGRTRVYFVDQKLKSFTENMKVLCSDDINMDIDLKVLISFDASEKSIEFIKQKVPAMKTTVEDSEVHELSLENFYKMAVRDIMRSSARNVISPNRTDDIRPNRESIEAQCNEVARERIKALNFPVSVSLLISNIDYPPIVTDARNRIKDAQLKDQERSALAEAELAEQQRQVAVEEERAKVRMVKAQAQADENRILTESLTPQFLMWRQFEVMENTANSLASSPNNTVFMMPYQTMSPDTLNTAVLRDSLNQSKPAAESSAVGGQ